MGFKSAYTAEEIALIWSGIYSYFNGKKHFAFHTLEEAKKEYDLIISDYWRLKNNETPKNDYEYYATFLGDENKAAFFESAYLGAIGRLKAINQAIAIGHIPTHQLRDLQLIDQKAIAAWFMDQDNLEQAEFFYSKIRSIWKPEPLKLAPAPISGDISTKTKNAYLKTISALSMALISGSTGKPFTDAEVVLSLLDKAGIEHPVSRRKLAEYLKEAGDN
ncbi:hypothetical protein AB4876_15595 [Zhongshania guokunii]|uniref:Uncharacterized protein n=1 Tax=Zhongshania guokunii TaxID=641783 RepID=A0ABV3U8Q7_9GAMM